MDRDALAVQRAQLSEMPTALIYEELARRQGEQARGRFHLSWCACEMCKRVRAAVLAEGERRDGE